MNLLVRGKRRSAAIGRSQHGGRRRRTWLSIVVGCLLATNAGGMLVAGQEEQPNAPAPDAHRKQVRPTTGEAVKDDVDQLEALQNRMRRLMRDAQERRKAQQERLRDLAAEKRALTRTVSSLEKENEKRQADLDETKKALSSVDEEMAELRKKSAALVATLDAYLKKLATSVRGGIPWRREERLQSIADARKNLADAKAAASTALATVARLQKEEEALGRLVETATLELDLPSGERVAVQGFHLGLLAVIFASEDAHILGFCRQGQSLRDGLTTVQEHPDAADGYLKAIEILKRQRTPALVDLYLPALPVGKEKGK